MLSRPSAGRSAASALVNAKTPFVCTRCLHLRRAAAAAHNNGTATATLPRPSLSSSARTTRRSIRNFTTTTAFRSSAAHSSGSNGGITPLPHRRLLALSGPHAPKFLQGLTTNNVRPEQETGWYTAFLNAQGRVLYDAFVYPTPLAAVAAGGAAAAAAAAGEGDWACFIEVDGGCVDSLHRVLKRHKLRSKIKLRVVDEGEWGVWGAWSTSTIDSLSADYNGKVVYMPDTRVPGFGGHRLLVSGSSGSGSGEEALAPLLASLERATPRDYQVRRYLHGLAEGPLEIRPEEALPLESNIDLMHGVDFRKGCYVGQELTIRTKHTGVVRKRILPVRLYDLRSEEPESLEFVEGEGIVKAEDVPEGVADVKKIADGAQQQDAEGAQAAAPPARRRKDGRSAGKWLAGVGNVGLALCRLEMMTDVKVAAEGMGPASGGYQPGMKFGLKWTVEGEDGEKDVGIKAFVPEWHRLRAEEEAKNKKKKIVQKEYELDE